MLKRTVLVLTVLTCVGVVFGAAVKTISFTPVGNENPEADGMAIFNYVAGTGENVLQIAITDFTPNTWYGWMLFDGEVLILQSHCDILTDEHGHGTSHQKFFLNGEDFSPYDLEIWTSTVLPTGVCQGPNTEKRAEGQK